MSLLTASYQSHQWIHFGVGCLTIATTNFHIHADKPLRTESPRCHLVMTVIITQCEDAASLALRFQVCSALTSLFLGMEQFSYQCTRGAHRVEANKRKKIQETSHPAVFNDKTPNTYSWLQSFSIDIISSQNAESHHNINSGTWVLKLSSSCFPSRWVSLFLTASAYWKRGYVPSGSISSFGASLDKSVMTKPSEMELHQPGNGRVTLTVHVKALFIPAMIELYPGGIFSHLPHCGCGTEWCVHWDLKWPNVLEMYCKFFHGLLQCRDRDINIAANHAFTWDFSHNHGPRHRDWISDVTGKWSWRVWVDFVKVCWVYLRERVRFGELWDLLWKCIKLNMSSLLSIWDLTLS